MTWKVLQMLDCNGFQRLPAGNAMRSDMWHAVELPIRRQHFDLIVYEPYERIYAYTIAQHVADAVVR